VLLLVEVQVEDRRSYGVVALAFELVGNGLLTQLVGRSAFRFEPFGEGLETRSDRLLPIQEFIASLSDTFEQSIAGFVLVVAHVGYFLVVVLDQRETVHERQ